MHESIYILYISIRTTNIQLERVYITNSTRRDLFVHTFTDTDHLFTDIQFIQTYTYIPLYMYESVYIYDFKHINGRLLTLSQSDKSCRWRWYGNIS